MKINKSVVAHRLRDSMQKCCRIFGIFVRLSSLCHLKCLCQCWPPHFPAARNVMLRFAYKSITDPIESNSCSKSNKMCSTRPYRIGSEKCEKPTYYEIYAANCECSLLIAQIASACINELFIEFSNQKGQNHRTRLVSCIDISWTSRCSAVSIGR